MMRIEALESGYYKIKVLKGIDVSVKEGECTCVVGPNGSGKSTLLRTISGLVQCTSGRVLFGELDITNHPSHRISKLGLVHVPEGRGIFPEMTVFENLTLGLYSVYKKLAKASKERRFKAVENLFPILERRKKQLAGTLSGGEQQMLAIGRGLMADPKLLMLDEPSFGLAPLIVDSILGTLSSLMAQGGLTLLLVEQNALKALKFSDYGYVLRVGEIVLSGRSKELLEQGSLVHAYLTGGRGTPEKAVN
jgi:branched-chain amino acid transport system ATP-binding protein